MTFPSETTSRRIAVIGGVNMDITGTPDTAMIDGDSNPGTVVLSPGGVGRNPTENLRRLGIKGKQITPCLSDKIQKLTGGKSLEANIRLV